MPYTVKITDTTAIGAFQSRFEEALTEDGYFAIPELTQVGNSLELRRVRKIAPSTYCGQHPGPCLVSPFGERPKQKNKLLEWDDWVRFHGIVNRVLDEMGASADVWTRPQEAIPMPGTGSRSRFWIRRGTLARIHYDWEDDYRPGRLLPTRLWNMGTPDQFRTA
jgi:hypothetical protein